MVGVAVMHGSGGSGAGGAWGKAVGAAGRAVDDDEEVSAGWKEKTRDSLLLSTGPAESGGVAVMELGKRTSWRFATAGEMGCAVSGVSGYVGAP